MHYTIEITYTCTRNLSRGDNALSIEITYTCTTNISRGDNALYD